MKHLLVIISFLLLLQSCKTSNIEDNLDDVIVKNKYKIEYSIDNSSSDSIGYEVWETDEDIGVKSLCVFEDIVYFTDVYHNNIKKLDLRSRKLISSKSFAETPPSQSGIWLRDIVVFDNKVYVTTDIDSIFIFDLDLNYQNSIYCKKGTKVVFDVNDERLLIYLGEKQLANKDMEYELLQINKDDSLKTITKSVTFEEYKENLETLKSLGKEYQLFNDDNNQKIKFEYGTIELDYRFGEITSYSARNITFSKSKLVYFDSNPSVLTFYIYEY